MLSRKTALLDLQSSSEQSASCLSRREPGNPGFKSLDFATLIFFLQNKVVSLAFNPETGGSVPRIYVPSDRVGSVISPGTASPFRGLLRIAGLRWRYSNPPPRQKLLCI
jgi:hypothetical protein